MEQPSPEKKIKLSLIEGANTSKQAFYPERKTVNDGTEKTHLISVLQTSLILEEVLQLFQNEVRNIVGFDSFHYQHLSMKVKIDTNKVSRHRCHYKMEMNGNYLGEISFSRIDKFSAAEIELLEELLSVLVYPLRNSLLYKKALASALFDELTNLGNRAAYENSLQREIDIAKRQKTPLSMIVLDIDNFKVINDSYGHANGDRALKMLADTVVHTMRNSDITYRYGGEEFVLLLANTAISDAMIAAERIREAVSQIVCQDNKSTFQFTISVGIAELNEKEQGYHLFERADMALYEAKRAGKNQIVSAQMLL
ncbi:MAG TPA: GGDEF domain-containing protein [Methylophaga aminisulfidivorans]|uniref:diguanylate cyclase n=2 Tax=root TaxID=1 RepID=A0A7C1ZXW8_9GAMM|nr:GGDEF domain-containing protein [Methylophaga aminisulfidivorans]